MPERQILALGGHGMQPGEPLDDLLLELTGASRPRVLLIPTASAENEEFVLRFYAAFARRAEASHLSLFDIPPPDNVLNVEVPKAAAPAAGAM